MDFKEWLSSNKKSLPDATRENFEKLYWEFIDFKANEYMLEFKEKKAELLAQNEQEHQNFIKRHINIWRDGFGLLELLLELCINQGSKYSTSLQQDKDTDTNNHLQLLIRLHAKACAISNEILCLLKNGFPDAAHARWRALHETNVTLHFIDKHGPKCSEIFLAHEIYDSYYLMMSHKKYESRLQEKGPSNEEARELTDLFDKAIKTYGRSFDSQYGWATPFLTDKKHKASFKSIEKEVKLDHMRPYFKWACQNIHVNIKTITNSLSLPHHLKNVINIGPSNFGLVDPAHATALSLTQSTCCLLKNDCNEENLIFMNLIKQLSIEIGDTFLSISNSIENK